MSQGTSEEGPDVMPELMVVPPPPPRRALPDPQVLGTPPLKPARPPSVNLTPYLSPPLEGKYVNIIHVHKLFPIIYRQFVWLATIKLSTIFCCQKFNFYTIRTLIFVWADILNFSNGK